MATMKRLGDLKAGDVFRDVSGNLWCVLAEQPEAVRRACVLLGGREGGGRAWLKLHIEVTPLDLPALLAERDLQARIISDLREELAGRVPDATKQVLRQCAALLHCVRWRLNYPGDPSDLARDVDAALAAAGKALGEPGAFAPPPRAHAGRVNVDVVDVTGGPGGNADA